MTFDCSLCKQVVRVLQPIGKGSYCIDCVKKIHEHIISKLPEEKIKYISYLEKQMLIDIFVYSSEKNLKCEFQYNIYDEDAGCSLEKAAERDNYDFKCVDEIDEDCTNCKYGYLNRYVKYILDFAIFKNKLKLNIELDGLKYHDKEKDMMRDKFMRDRGWTVIRFPSYSVTHRKEDVINKIDEVIQNG